jgi:hypothetical protein
VVPRQALATRVFAGLTAAAILAVPRRPGYIRNRNLQICLAARSSGLGTRRVRWVSIGVLCGGTALALQILSLGACAALRS